jgi:hypothetical protein
VLGFFSSRLKASFSPPPPPPRSGGGSHTRLRERGWGSPSSDEWTYTVLYFVGRGNGRVYSTSHAQTLASKRQNTASRTGKDYFFLPSNYNPSSMLSAYWSLPNTRYKSTKQTMCFLKITAISLYQQRRATHQFVLGQ